MLLRGLRISVSNLGCHCRDCQPFHPGCRSGSDDMRIGMDIQWDLTQLASSGRLLPLASPDTQAGTFRCWLSQGCR